KLYRRSRRRRGRQAGGASADHRGRTGDALELSAGGLLRLTGAPSGLDDLKDAAARVSVQDKKPPVRLIEADIGSADAGHCSKGQATLCNHPVAYVFDDIGDG